MSLDDIRAHAIWKAYHPPLPQFPRQPVSRWTVLASQPQPLWPEVTG